MNDDSEDLEPIDVSGAGAPVRSWAPGWYADPWTAGQYRYWTGETWTGETSRWGPASGAVAATGSVPPAGSATAGTGMPGSATAGSVTEPWPALPSPPVGFGLPAGSPVDAGPGGPTRSPGPVVLGVILLVALLLLSGAVGYAIESSRSHSKSAASLVPSPTITSPTPTPPASTTPTTPASLDPGSHVLGSVVVQQSDVAAARRWCSSRAGTARPSRPWTSATARTRASACARRACRSPSRCGRQHGAEHRGGAVPRRRPRRRRRSRSCAGSAPRARTRRSRARSASRPRRPCSRRRPTAHGRTQPASTGWLTAWSRRRRAAPSSVDRGVPPARTRAARHVLPDAERIAARRRRAAHDRGHRRRVRGPVGGAARIGGERARPAISAGRDERNRARRSGHGRAVAPRAYTSPLLVDEPVAAGRGARCRCTRSHDASATPAERCPRTPRRRTRNTVPRRVTSQ